MSVGPYSKSISYAFLCPLVSCDTPTGWNKEMFRLTFEPSGLCTVIIGPFRPMTVSGCGSYLGLSLFWRCWGAISASLTWTGEDLTFALLSAYSFIFFFALESAALTALSSRCFGCLTTSGILVPGFLPNYNRWEVNVVVTRGVEQYTLRNWFMAGKHFVLFCE